MRRSYGIRMYVRTYLVCRHAHWVGEFQIRLTTVIHWGRELAYGHPHYTTHHRDDHLIERWRCARSGSGA